MKMNNYIKTSMKQIYHILCLLAVAALTACSQADDTTAATDTDGRITIKFTAEPATRTTLASSDDVQHVTYVQVYVFDGTGDDAPCVTSENVGWNQLTGGTATQYYTLKHRLDNGKTYTVLAVGLDDKTYGSGDNAKTVGAGTTYDLPDAIKEGTKLRDAVATLADELNTEDKAAEAAYAITHSELFAGSNTITVGPNSSNVTEITLRRRVAGVMMYLTNIPPDVKAIELKLYKPMITNVPLIAKVTDDYGKTENTLPSSKRGDILFYFEIDDEELKSEVVTDEGGNVIGTKLPGTVLVGAYLLPMPAPIDEDYTLMLTQYTNDGTGFKPLKPGQKVILKNPEAGEDNTMYPIKANYIYSIGKKADGVDEPFDLKGSADGDIYIDGNWQADIKIPMGWED